MLNVQELAVGLLISTKNNHYEMTEFSVIKVKLAIMRYPSLFGSYCDYNESILMWCSYVGLISLRRILEIDGQKL